MTVVTVAAVGWTAAAAALTAAALAWRGLVTRREAIAEACHELRGPLAAVTLGLHAGTDGALAPDRLRAIELELGRAALALGDLQSGRGPRGPGGDPEIVDLGELAARSAEAWRAVAELRGIELRVRPTRGRALVHGDRLRLAQAAGNLVSNAIEHGEGEVVLSARAAAEHVRFEVTDAGPGLPAPISELVGRASAGRRGHGLRVASAIATAHGGRLSAAPSHSGTRVVLELPAATPGRSAPPAAGRS